METALILHSIIRWGIVIFGLWAVIIAILGLIRRRPYTASDNRSGLLFMIFCDIQFLLGLILLVKNGWFDKLKMGMGPLMKNSYDRFFVVEHALMMIIAWVLVHIGRSAVKKAATDRARHKKMLIYYGIALVLIIISVPWPFRTEVARPFFRWFN